MPLIYFFGKEIAHPIYPGLVPIAQMGPGDLWATYIKPMGAGAVAAAGVITLIKTMPTIFERAHCGTQNHAPRRSPRRPSPCARKTISPCAW